MDGFHPTESLNLAPMSVQKDNFRECKQQQTPGKMCVIGKDFGGPCPGDSGSPLVNKKGEIIGVTHSVYAYFHHVTVSSTFEELWNFVSN